MFASIISTVLGGLLLAFVLYLLKEYFWGLPKLNGNWIFEIVTTGTDFNPYQDMMLRYYVLLIQDGKDIKGTGEKVYEKSSKQEIEFTGKNRSRIEIYGIIKKNYFSKDTIEIHYDETNEVRKSSSIHNLCIQNSNNMNGSFVSTIANQQGRATWIRRTSS